MANLPTRNNNPGDLKNTQTGAFNQYPTAQAGQDALINDLNIKMSGESKTGLTPQSSLLDFASKYAPNSDGNNSTKYANDLASQLGVPVSTPIGSLRNRVQDFASAIAKNEGYQGNQVAGTEQTTAPAQQIPDTNSSAPKPMLSHSQLIANINAMEQQGAKPQEVQDYLDSLKSDSSSIGGQSVPSSGRKTFAESVPIPAPTGPQPTAAGSLIRGLINGSGLPSIAASGVNLLQTITGQPETDTFHNGYLGDVSRVGKGYQPEQSPLSKQNIGPTLSAAGNGVGLAGTVGGVEGLLKGGASLLGGESASALTSPAVKTGLQGIGVDSATFKAMSYGDQLEALTQAGEKAGVADKAVIQQAIDKITPQAIQEAGGKVAFSQLHPTLSKILGLGGTALKEGLGGGLVAAGGYGIAKKLGLIQ